MVDLCRAHWHSCWKCQSDPDVEQDPRGTPTSIIINMWRILGTPNIDKLPLGRVHQAEQESEYANHRGDPLNRFCTENITIKNYDENLFSEDYARTISSENYDENPLSKENNRNLLGKD